MTTKTIPNAIARIERALAAYNIRGRPDLDDVICDLPHYASEQGADVAALLKNAEINWRTERREAGVK